MPLFPPDAKDIKIQQGNTGNCFLLASIHSLIQYPEGFKKLKSMFTENPDGSITVRIKRSERSERLEPKKMEGKYDYVHDEQAGEDVFTVKPDKIAEIQKAQIGVQTECLPIKIIERISSYYYYNQTSMPGEPNFSVAMHNNRDSTKDPSAAFVANIFDLYPKDNLNISQVIALKKAFPNFPVYLSMDYDHARHAYSVNAVRETDKNLMIQLVNPWDNTATEEHSYATITKKHGRWCFFAPTLTSYHLANWLITRSDALFSSLIEEPHALDFLGEVLSHNPQLGWNLLNKAQELIKKSPPILAYYTRLQSPQREAFAAYISAHLNSALNVNHDDPSVERDAASLETPKGFLEYIIIQAAFEKQINGMSNDAALSYVRGTLIDYHFFEGLQNLTSAGSLRSLFTGRLAVLPSKLILEVCSSRDLHLRALSYYFINKENSKAALKAAEPIVLDAYECQKLLTMHECPKEMLFDSIYKISKENPQVALQLAHYLLEHSQEFYQCSQAELITRTKLPAVDEGFRSWFDVVLQQPLHFEKPIIELNTVSSFIEGITIDYTDMDLEQIARHRDQLMSQLKNTLCRDAESQVRTIEELMSQKHPDAEMKQIYTTKKRQIENRAASRILHAAIRALNAVNCRLNEYITLSELEQAEKGLSAQINAIIEHPAVVAATKVKGLAQDLTLFEKAQRRVKNDLKEAKETQQNHLTEIEARATSQNNMRALEHAIVQKNLLFYSLNRKLVSDAEVLSLVKSRPELRDKILALELDTPPVNRQLLLDINRLSNPHAQAHLGTELLKQVIQNAKLNKHIAGKIELVKAVEYIRTVLVGYQLGMNPMTRSGNLRDYFDEDTPLFTCEQLNEINAPEELDFHAVKYFFTETNRVTEAVEKRVQGLHLFKEELYPEIFAQINLMVVPNFSAMFYLSKYNPHLAQSLAQYALKHAQSLYGLDAEQIAAKINASVDGALSAWFKQLTIKEQGQQQSVPQIAAHNLQQERNNMNSVLNELSAIIEQQAHENIMPLVVLIRDNFNTVNAALFNPTEERARTLADAYSELKDAIAQLPKPSTKTTEKVLRQLARGINEVIQVMKRLPNSNLDSTPWLELLEQISSPSPALSEFSAAAAELNEHLMAVPSGPIRELVVQVAGEIKGAMDAVEQKKNLVGLGSAVERIDKGLSDLSSVSRPSVWTKIIDCLGRMIRALISAVSGVKKNNHPGFFKSNEETPNLDALLQRAEDLKLPPPLQDDSRGNDCKVS